MASLIKLIFILMSIYSIVSSYSNSLLINNQQSPNNLFNYTLSNDIVESVAKILGTSTFSVSAVHQDGTKHYMPLMPVCLNYIKSVISRHQQQVRPKFVTKPFEIILLESCEPFISLMIASAGRPNQKDLMSGLSSLGFTLDNLDEESITRLYNELLKIRLDGPFRTSAGERLIWPSRSSDHQQLQTVRDFFSRDTNLKKSIFTYSGYCHHKKLDRYDHNSNNLVYGECFFDKVMETYSNLMRRWNVHNDYLKIIGDSIENTIRNCNQNIQYILNEEMINGTYGTNTIETLYEENGNTVGDRMSMEDNQRFYSVRDALLDVMLVSSGKYSSLYRQSLETLFADATKLVSLINLEEEAHKKLLISNILEFLRIRSKQVYYRSILEIDVAQIIYNQHLLMACKKIKQSFRGRLEARVSQMMATRIGARVRQPSNTMSHLVWLENPDRDVNGLSSLLNIVYQSCRMCDWFEKNGPRMTLNLVQREYRDKPLMFVTTN